MYIFKQCDISIIFVFGLLALLSISTMSVGKRTNFILKDIVMCHPEQDYVHYFKFNFYYVNEQQYADVNFTLKVPMDTKISMNGSGYILLQNRYVHLYTLRDKDACKALHTFMGEFVYDLERKANLVPGLCPIKQGHYYARNYEVQLDKLTFPIESLPVGNVRIQIMEADVTGKLITCFYVILAKA